MTFSADRSALADPKRRAAEARRMMTAYAESVAALEVEAYTLLSEQGFELPPEPDANKADPMAWSRWDSECFSAASKWIEGRRPILVTEMAALRLLSRARELREALDLKADDPTLADLKTVTVSAASASLGASHLLFIQSTDGFLASGIKLEQRQRRRSEHARKSNAERSSWHEYAFRIIADRLAREPKIQPKKLYGWAADQVNAYRSNLGKKPLSDNAVSKAVERKRALFDGLVEKAKQELRASSANPQFGVELSAQIGALLKRSDNGSVVPTPLMQSDHSLTD